MKNKSFRLFPSSIAATFILLAPALHADLITWDAGGGDTNWSTLLNWSDDASPAGDDITFNTTGAVAAGTTNTVSASETIASLSYSFEDAANQHTTSIEPAQTLTVAGNFLLASGATAATATNVTLSGGTGTLTVGNGVDSLFQVGQTTPTAATNTNSLDMNGLGTFTANLGSGGILRLGPSVVGQFGAVTTVKLAATSSITANEIGIGDKAGRGGTHALKLGSTANTINANTISIGPGPVGGGRGAGDLSFETSTGTLMLRAADGASAVTTVNLINSSFGTANNLTATVNLAAHSIDAKIGTLNMARRNSTGAAANGTANLTFDTGTLEVDTANMGVNAQPASTSGAISATMNIGGGSASFNTINMATSSGGSTSTTTALLNLTGGTTTVNGDITKGGSTGTGTTSATVALKGGTLDMTAGNIGDSTNPVTLTLNSGTLKNVAQINGGGSISKTTAGSLTLSGANTFTGDVTIPTVTGELNELKITESGSLGIGPKTITVANWSSLTFDGTAGNIVLASDLSIRATGISILNLAGDNVINGTVTTVTGNGTATVTSNGGSLTLAGNVTSAGTNNRVLQLSGTSTGANTVSGAISNGTATSLAITKSGAGTWSLTSASNTYTGNTSVQEGILIVSTPNFADTSTVSIGTLANPGVAFLNLPNAGDDTVKTLSIDGVVQPGGKTYGNSSSILPIIATSAITGPGTITVPASGTPYTLWAATFLPGNDVSNPAGDNDNDGLVNQQEFAFGLSPIDGSSVNPILVQLDKSAGTFTYQRRASTGLTYRIQTSIDLIAWPEDTTATTLGQVATPSGSNEIVVVTLTGPLTAPKLFVRVAAD